MITLLFLLSLLLLLGQSHANVEKVIFLGPSNSDSSSAGYSGVPRLSPENHTIRTQLHSKFEHSPSISSVPSVAWYILDGLAPGARYEVRICWPATQPTAFGMDVFTEKQATEAGFGVINKASKDQDLKQDSQNPESSWLLLKVEANADYFTMNSTLMHNGLLVDVDIILDPYLLNVFPKSLWPTGLHILMVSALAVVAVKLVLRHLDGVVAAGRRHAVKDKKRA